MKIKIFFSIFVFSLLIFANNNTDNTISSDSLFTLMDSYYDTIKDYSCYLQEYVVKGKKYTDNVWIYEFVKPHYIYMESIKGNRKGSKAFFDCETKKVTGRQGGILSKIKLTLSLDNKLVKNKKGITIAESDWFYIINRYKRILKEEKVNYSIIKTDSQYVLTIKNIPFDKYGFTGSKVFINFNGFMPHFINYENGKEVEVITYTDIKLNIGLDKEEMRKKV